jgi:two-component system, NarL family, response regulator YdfI
MIRVFARALALESMPSIEFVDSVEAADVVISDEIVNFPIPVILLTNTADSSVVSSALRSGIRGVISSEATSQEIEAAVHAVDAGLVVLADPPIAPELIEPLTDRELELLELLAEGLSNKLIAHRLGISEHTVKTHVASIFAKIGVSSRTEAVSQAIRRGLVML